MTKKLNMFFYKYYHYYREFHKKTTFLNYEIFNSTSRNIFVLTNLCQQICAWTELLEKRPPFLNLRLIQGTFLLNCTFLLNSQFFRQKIALPRAITNWKFWPSTFLLWGGLYIIYIHHDEIDNFEIILSIYPHMRAYPV